MNRTGLNMIQADSLEQVQGQCVYPLVAEEHREAFQALVRDIFQGKSGALEFKIIGLKGRPCWLYSQVVPLRNNRGDIVFALSVTDDITERKNAEEQLRKSEASLKKAETLGNMGYWEWNILTNKLIWSDEVFSLYGLDPRKDKPTYETVVQTVGPECRDRFVKAIDDAIRIGAPFDGEYRMIGLDGKERFTHTTGEVIRNKEGTPVSMFGIVQDITERIKAERTLRETKELLALFMRHSPVYTYIKEVTPTESRVLLASENFKQMIGIAGSDMTGKTMAELFPPEFAAKITADDYTVVSNGKILKLDEELNGRSYTTIKFPLAQGERTLLAGYTIDITERRKAEEERETIILELKDAIVKIKQLSGMLPICASCKKIRDDKGYWNRIETYITEHSEVLFSHGLCPDCAKKAYEELDELKKERDENQL